jgi:hypothetical protein
VVVWEGETLIEVPVTVPIPEIDKVAAPVTDQERLEELPVVMDAGEAVKEEITGNAAPDKVETNVADDCALVLPAGSQAASV